MEGTQPGLTVGGKKSVGRRVSELRHKKSWKGAGTEGKNWNLAGPKLR